MGPLYGPQSVIALPQAPWRAFPAQAGSQRQPLLSAQVIRSPSPATPLMPWSASEQNSSGSTAAAHRDRPGHADRQAALDDADELLGVPGRRGASGRLVLLRGAGPRGRRRGASRRGCRRLPRPTSGQSAPRTPRCMRRSCGARCSPSTASTRAGRTLRHFARGGHILPKLSNSPFRAPPRNACHSPRCESENRAFGVLAVANADLAVRQARHLDAVAVGETQGALSPVRI